MLAIMSHALLLLYHFIFSFISSVSFGIICDVPRKTLVLLANIGQICAIKFKNPVTVYFVPGLVPVVPGVTIYDAFRTLLLDDYGNSGKIFLNSFYGAIGLAVGIIIADSIFRVVLKPLLNKKSK